MILPPCFFSLSIIVALGNVEQVFHVGFNNGYKDLFVEESKSEYINITPIQAYQAARS